MNLLGSELWVGKDSLWGRAAFTSLGIHAVLIFGVLWIVFEQRLHRQTERVLLEVTVIEDNQPSPMVAAPPSAAPAVKPTPAPPLQEMKSAMKQISKRPVSAEPTLVDRSEPLQALSKLTQLSTGRGAQPLLVDAQGPGISISEAISQKLSGPGQTPLLRERPQTKTAAALPGVAKPVSSMGTPALKDTSGQIPSGFSSVSSFPAPTVNPSREIEIAAGSPVGTTIQGEIASRKVLKSKPPHYPEWAQRQGVQATVSLRLVVLSDGRVKPNILIERTSGYRALDQAAVDTLKQWLFEPLPTAVWQEQWGVVNFVFLLESNS